MHTVPRAHGTKGRCEVRGMTNDKKISRTVYADSFSRSSLRIRACSCTDLYFPVCKRNSGDERDWSGEIPVWAEMETVK